MSIEELIIHKVQQYSWLYKKNDKDYVNNYKDDEAWVEIAAYVAKVKNMPSFTGLFIPLIYIIIFLDERKLSEILKLCGSK